MFDHIKSPLDSPIFMGTLRTTGPGDGRDDGFGASISPWTGAPDAAPAQPSPGVEHVRSFKGFINEETGYKRYNHQTYTFCFAIKTSVVLSCFCF